MTEQASTLPLLMVVDESGESLGLFSPPREHPLDRILITGSRDWADEYTVSKALRDVWLAWGGPHDVVLCSGHASGADTLAEQVWERQGFPVEKHPAGWRKHGKAAGFIRNKEMVDLGADILLAFVGPCTKQGCRTGVPGHGSHGASMTCDIAATAGIPVHRFSPFLTAPSA